MKLYLETKLMTFEDGEHEIILRVSDIEFYAYDLFIELKDDDKFIKNTMKIIYKKDKDGKDTKEINYKQFNIRENNSWWSFPLYEFEFNRIIPFDYTKYSYFANTERRMALALKINLLYGPSSEFKILRRTLAYIMDELNLNYPEKFSIMDKKINDIIQRNPKDKIK